MVFMLVVEAWNLEESSEASRHGHEGWAHAYTSLPSRVTGSLMYEASDAAAKTACTRACHAQR